PKRASASDRLVATVLLPTPPLPLMTSTTFFTPGTGSSGAGLRLEMVAGPCVEGTSLVRESDSLMSRLGYGDVGGVSNDGDRGRRDQQELETLRRRPSRHDRFAAKPAGGRHMRVWVRVFEN